jgi:hypothetical protein
MVTGPDGAGLYVASNAVVGPVLFTWRLRTPCQISDGNVGACVPGNPAFCPAIDGRLIGNYVIQRQRLAQADGSAVDGVAPPAGTAAGSPFGPWNTTGTGCVDVTELNPPPSPAEVFRYLQVLPLPELTLHQQPPGNGLVGLPVIFYTDSPTTQAFTVDIRGFTVDISATATDYTWHTGDGATLTSTEPGAPYPHHTVTHDYRAGTYTASLTTTWGATYTIDGGPPITVPGSTTTEGAPVTFTVVQARAVLTNPYD